MEKIGIVGIGAMGSALLERLKKSGVTAIAFDTAPVGLQAASALGVRLAPSGKALGEAATLIDIVVRTDRQVIDCTIGRNGVLEGAPPGSLILLHSTILPETTKKVAEAARERNVAVIDACMTTVPKGVRDGNLVFLVGGAVPLVERATPHLLRMAKDVMHMGPLGAGNVAKLITNLVSASETLVLYEAIRIGAAAGIGCEAALEMMRTTASTPTLQRWRERFDIGDGGAKLRPGGIQNLFDKDLPHAAKLGHQLGVDIPITDELAITGMRLAGD